MQLDPRGSMDADIDEQQHTAHLMEANHPSPTSSMSLPDELSRRLNIGDPVSIVISNSLKHSPPHWQHPYFARGPVAYQWTA